MGERERDASLISEAWNRHTTHGPALWVFPSSVNVQIFFFPTMNRMKMKKELTVKTDIDGVGYTHSVLNYLQEHLALGVWVVFMIQ